MKLDTRFPVLSKINQKCMEYTGHEGRGSYWETGTSRSGGEEEYRTRSIRAKSENASMKFISYANLNIAKEK